MPRIARRDILYDGCYAHIISRSIRKMRIMKDAEDFGELYRLLEQTKRKAGYEIYHYCFMHSHFHLAVKIPDVGEFFNAMRCVKGRYSHIFHAKYRVSGPIWRERYRSLLIEDEGYPRACGRYIESNPVIGGLAAKAADWRFSSFRYYAGEAPDALIDAVGEYEKPEQAAQIDCAEEKFFEHGHVIGSDFFRWQFFERRKSR